MHQPSPIAFGPFHLDLTMGGVWRGGQRLPLRPYAVAVLQYLIERAGEVVSAEELCQQIWAGTHVSRTVLRVCIRAIRVALGMRAPPRSISRPSGAEAFGFEGCCWPARRLSRVQSLTLGRARW
jgi:DNA-binding winged helix-turn-helix (wHTH) protein